MAVVINLKVIVEFGLLLIDTKIFSWFVKLKTIENTEFLAIGREDTFKKPSVLRSEIHVIVALLGVFLLQSLNDSILDLMRIVVIKVVLEVVGALRVVMELNQLTSLELRQQPLRLAHACLSSHI